MAKIRIKRSSEYFNRFRNYEIVNDGNSIGNIANGQTKEFDVKAGLNKIKATIDWCSSAEHEIVVDENKVFELEVSGFKYGNQLIIGALIIFIIQICLTFFTQLKGIAILMLPFIFILAYYITLGKNKYLRLKFNKTFQFFTG